MTDLTPFEQRLAERLGVELTGVVAPFDPAAIAGTAIAGRTVRDRLLNRLVIGPLPVATARRAALAAVAVLLALATIALVIGALRPGGGRLAFIRTNGDVVVSAPDGSGENVIFRVPSPVLFTQLEWAPDGAHLAIVDEDVELTIIDTTGAVKSRKPLDLGTSRIEWSPDGRRLAILDGPWLPLGGETCSPPLVHPHLDVLAPDGTIEWTAPLPPEFRYTAGLGELAWSPDGRRIAIAGSAQECHPDVGLPSSIWIADLEQSTVRELSPGGADVIDFQPFWLPDGRLLFSRADRGIVEVDVETGATSTVVDTTGACAACTREQIRIEDLSPDGSRLVLRQPGTRLIVLDLTTNAVTVVRPEGGGAGVTAPIMWTPDGTELLVDFAPTFLDPPTVVAIDIASSSMREVLTDTRFFAVLD